MALNYQPIDNLIRDTIIKYVHYDDVIDYFLKIFQSIETKKMSIKNKKQQIKKLIQN